MDTQEKTFPRLQILTSSAQLQGARWRQEDSCLLRASSHGRIAFIADGLGGHVRGDEASALGAGAAALALLPLIEQPQPIPETALHDAFVRAHDAVCTLPGGRHAPAATTLVGGLFRVQPAVACLGNVGDSLALRLRDGELEHLFLPQGHGNWVEFALGYGIGTDGSAIETRTVDLQAGDRFLLASDGLLTLKFQAVREVLALDSPRACCEQLLSRIVASARPNQDNCTVQVLFVEEGP